MKGSLPLVDPLEQYRPKQRTLARSVLDRLLDDARREDGLVRDVLLALLVAHRPAAHPERRGERRDGADQRRIASRGGFEPGQHGARLVRVAGAADLGGAQRLHLDADLGELPSNVQQALQRAIDLGRHLFPSAQETGWPQGLPGLALVAGGIAVDPQRLAQEIAILADKLDVGEEMDRFSSHITAFREALLGRATEGVGKRLGFLLQEMLREANTTGSKANDAAMLQDVVAIKEELERIREQVENLE